MAGTERGVTEPEATFSACFGAAFLTLHPLRYAALLREKLDAHGSAVYLVNTGWSGGSAAGGASRMSIAATRACVDAVLDGSIAELSRAAADNGGGGDSECPYFETDPVFGFKVPRRLGLDASPSASIPLLPREAWSDPDAYDAARLELAAMFVENFKKYDENGSTGLANHGPMLK